MLKKKKKKVAVSVLMQQRCKGNLFWHVESKKKLRAQWAGLPERHATDQAASWSSERQLEGGGFSASRTCEEGESALERVVPNPYRPAPSSSAVPPRFPPAQRGKETICAGVTSEERERAKEKPLEEERECEGRAEGRWWEQSAETLHRASVCLHSRAAAASTSVAPSGSPSAHTHTHAPHHPLFTQSPSHLLSFYLPVVPFNNSGACWYAEQRWSI